MKPWFNFKRALIAFLIVGTISAFFYINGGLIPAENANTATKTGISYQIESIAKTRGVIETVAKNEIKDETSLPLTVVASSEMLRLLENPANSVSYLTVNRTNLLAVAAIKRPNSELAIYGAYYLEDQQARISEVADTRNINLSVVSTPTTGVVAGSTNYPYGTTANNTSNVSSTATPSSPSSVFGTILNLLLIALLLYWIVRLLRNRGIIGTRKKVAQVAETPSTRFTDVAGCDEAIEDMKELVDFLKNPEKFEKTGAHAPRGALLVGPPGTGKTLLARAVAGEAGVPFYSAAGSDFVEMYVGVGAKRIRELFNKAKQHEEGAIIFIDEIDAVGRARASGVQSAGNTEGENTLNALLVEMDGFTSSKVIVLGATNRDDMLDAALTRPGRLDRKIQVPLPDRVGRFKILQVHAAGKPFEANVDWDLVARRTPGMSGAELASVVNEACLVAARADRDEVTNKDLDAAIATVAMGKPRTSAIVSPHDRLVTAWHEAGHTVAAMVLPDADDPVSVSIIPRGPAGGVTWMSQGDDIFLTRKRAFARLVVAMGGRAAEELLLDGEFTSGPHGDLTAATQTALAMVTQYGMTDMGLMVRSEGFLSTGAKLTDDTVTEVEKLLADALDVARKTLKSHKELLNLIVEGLLEYDTLTQEDLLTIRAGKKFTPPALPGAPKEYKKNKVEVPVVPVRARKTSRVSALLGALSAGIETFRDIAPKKKGKGY